MMTELKMWASLLLVLTITVYTTCASPVQVQEALKGLKLPTYNGKSFKIDLAAKPDKEFLNKSCIDDSTFWLYTRANPQKAQQLKYKDESSIYLSNFDAFLPTVFLVHGWLGSESEEDNYNIRDALLNKEPSNVILVDWSFLAQKDYITVCAGIPDLGRSLARFLEFLKNTSTQDYSLMHLVGFSVGAHLVGKVGRELQGHVARITGLDPAGPLWYENPERLSGNDALYVEAIHTDGLVFGINVNIAQVDFYPNGGVSQPGCILDKCNHFRSKELFAATVTYNHLIGNLCKNDFEFLLDLCTGPVAYMGNNELFKNSTQHGMYRLKTGGTYPFNL